MSDTSGEYPLADGEEVTSNLSGPAGLFRSVLQEIYHAQQDEDKS